MGRVKGSVFMPWVIGVRADKSGACLSHLSDEDRKIVSSKILTSSWYPFEAYVNVANAVVKELAGDNMDLVRQWGRDFTENTYRHIYTGLFSETDSKKAMKSHQMIFKTLYDFITIEVEEVSENDNIITFKGVDPNLKSWFYSALGTFEKALEYSGAKGLKAEFTDKSWEGASATRVRFTWAGWG